MSTAPSTASRRALITGGGAGIGAVTARSSCQQRLARGLLDRDGAEAEARRMPSGRTSALGLSKATSRIPRPSRPCRR